MFGNRNKVIQNIVDQEQPMYRTEVLPHRYLDSEVKNGLPIKTSSNIINPVYKNKIRDIILKSNTTIPGRGNEVIESLAKQVIQCQFEENKIGEETYYFVDWSLVSEGTPIQCYNRITCKKQIGFFCRFNDRQIEFDSFQLPIEEFNEGIYEFSLMLYYLDEKDK